MKKIIALIVFAVMLCAMLAGCGATNYDYNFTVKFKTALIKCPNGEALTVNIDVFCENTHNNQVRIVSTDGKVYSTAWQNVVLIGERVEE